MPHAVPQPDNLSRSAPPPEDITEVARRRARSGKRATTNPESCKPKLPVVGDEIFGFRLRKELGRGAYASVFLAEQSDLAGRPVALKVTDLEGDEPQTLAQLQHTHIVPIYSVHENAEIGLRAVCMPYFGGASLAEILKALSAETRPPTTGEHLVHALKAGPNPTVAEASRPAVPAGPPPDDSSEQSTPASSPSSTSGEGEPAPLSILSGLDYIQAAVWIVARLAEALQHAHQRGVLHRDIKPSNILLGADGQPMLLDFNVAQTTRNSQTRAILGGTVAYMAPEHLEAIASQDSALAARLDHRADIYSLGIVLYETLAGSRPFGLTKSFSAGSTLLHNVASERRQTAVSPRQLRPDVPWSLESIVRKCLAPDPALRYQQAEHLAEDLRRFLENRPLKYAPELSWSERARKWLRRHPRVASSGSVALLAALLLVSVGAGLVGVQEHLARTRAELAVAQAQDRKDAYEAGTVRALCLVNTTSEVQDHLRQGATVCEETLALYGVLDSPDWQQNPNWQQLPEADRHRLMEDTRELLLLLARARVSAHPSAPPVLENALLLLDRAEAINGLAPSRAVWEDRARYLDQLGRTSQAQAARKTAEQIPPTSAHDHYLLATAYARSGHYDKAVQELNQALQLKPRHYWSLIQRGICYQELGQYTLAAGDFGTCIGLWPEFAWGYFNRGYVLEKRGHRREAISDYSAALQRDPKLVLAYLNRGLARLELKEYEPALGDFRKAAALGRDEATLHLGMGAALEGLGRHQEADAAFRMAFERAGSVPPPVRTRLAWVYGFAVSERLPEKARQAFREVLRTQPDHPQALYGQAMLLVKDGQERAAIALFSKAIAAFPTFVEARRFRAVLLARASEFDAAGRDVNACLEREPDSGATLYAAACVAALALDKSRSPAARKQIAVQAIGFLQNAFAHGYGRDKAAQDPDLRALQQLPEFTALLARRR